jgi:transcription-repair coupling factor (superfamily II helicase)
MPEQRFLVLSEREVFGEEPRAAERKSRGRAAFLSDFRDLKVGSPVVHVDHGIARYAGLGRPKGGSLNRDFMVLEFAGGDRLFVPVDRLDLVQKYSGVAGNRPHLDRLGGPGWERIKSRVRKSVESMAKELLELYARRRTAEGNAFSPDTPWQQELEAAFPYELTPDQERAIREVKQDMESPRPMDRLLVGDVGFGKTEVSVRAAFKAVMDGFQVAVLAPTTVLAAQHFGTFRDRFAQFPVRVEMVSRFRSAADIKGVLEKVGRGEIDVLIGTHRLLSRDVSFRRLGLLVVDEEQRFGVAHKERVKKLTVGIDVLAMTATPIPRTLQMSLAGVRDLSIIETPPPGRSAIQTYLVPFRKSVIAQAIRQELRRNGQVFVVHDRVETLPAVARAVRELVPEARLVTAHGQLPERELERVMLRFVNREADVLVTTSIIENGLDIPSANTIVVNRADRFGLAQLYQLRGRVGRSVHHAYAYFIIPARHALSENARKRLKALQEFSELGAGFRLAAADLEIRGAGEFLGSKQHGHIASLGFDLYAQLLEQAVRELQGEKIEERAPVSLHLGVDIKVPESYMPEVGDRLVLYKKLASARDGADVDRLQAETEDRYGHLPPSGINLFDMGRLRVAAEAAGVRAVDVADGKLQVRFQEKPRVEPRRVIEMLARERGTLTPSGMMLLPAPDRAGDRIRTVRELLDRLASETAA